MLTFADLKNLLAQQGFGNVTAITHVAASLREAGLISAGAKTPMTAEDAVVLMLGMSCRGTVREKFHNVEALLAMKSQEDPDGRRFGAFLAGRLLEPMEDGSVHRLTIYPDTPCATFETGARGNTRTLTWGRDLEPHKGPIWSVGIGTMVLRRIGEALR